MVPVMLILAVGSGLTGTLLTRASDGFRRWWFGVAAIVAYAIATALMAWLVQQMPVGAVYAIWTGSAAAVLLVIDRVFFSEHIRPLQYVGILSILVGVVALSIGTSR